ncbi:DUF6458 family protein [Sporichthya polymorpha]|uniref:DUF6458 family protein n=1 Tax=Sporichthya polymorpha TaxID=35751 RepID=UPI000363A5A1|nr:DUF6458 family protein [Sporichthya polymorpha]
MGIGVGIFLAAVGAVLAFAVEDTVRNVDLYAVGWILMIAGAVSVLLDLVIFGPRRRAYVDTAAAPVVEERRVYEDRPRY